MNHSSRDDFVLLGLENDAFLFFKNSFICGLVYFRNILPQEELSFLFPFSENNNVLIFPFPFQVFMSLVNLWLIRLHGQFPILKTRSCPKLCPPIRPPRRPLAFSRGRILIPRFTRSPPLLAVCDLVHTSR